MTGKEADVNPLIVAFKFIAMETTVEIGLARMPGILLG